MTRGREMSVATTVPERYGSRDDDAFEADDAFDEVRRAGLPSLILDSIRRFRAADAMSYSRALGLSAVLSLIPALIAVVGLSTVVGSEASRSILRDTLQTFSPGPAGTVLDQSLRASSEGWTALWAGLAGMLLSGTIGMVELERAANNIYGVREDRPVIRRYLLAFILAITVGVLMLLSLVVIAAGGAVGDAATSGGILSGTAGQIWSIARWPAGVLLIAVAMTVIFKVVPNRDQPPFSWLTSGTTVAVALWVGVTLLLSFFYENASGSSQAYGRLLGIVALLLWAHLSSVAVLFGMSFAAELEDRRGRETNGWSDGDEYEA
jgi:YihY family inner membrane protein